MHPNRGKQRPAHGAARQGRGDPTRRPHPILWPRRRAAPRRAGAPPSQAAGRRDETSSSPLHTLRGLGRRPSVRRNGDESSRCSRSKKAFTDAQRTTSGRGDPTTQVLFARSRSCSRLPTGRGRPVGGPQGRVGAARPPPPQKILGAPGTAGRGLDSRGISWTRRGFVVVRRAGRAASCGAAGPAQRDRVLVPPGALSGRARAFCATAGLLRAAASSCNLLVCV